MAELFGVTTDYLLKDSEELPEVGEFSGAVVDETYSLVSLEEANAFLDIKRSTAPHIARAVAMCILSPALLILLAGFSDTKMLSEALAVGIGVTVLFLMIAVAVYTFIVMGKRTEAFEYLEKEPFETAYGITGMVNERKRGFAETFSSRLAIGVILCILCPIPLIISAVVEADEFVITAMVSVLLLIVATGVYTIVRVSIVESSYNILLQEGEYTIKDKEINKKFSPIAGIYWSVMVAIYLSWSFLSGRWDMTWVVWPIAGVSFGVISAIYNTIARRK